MIVSLNHIRIFDSYFDSIYKCCNNAVLRDVQVSISRSIHRVNIVSGNSSVYDSIWRTIQKEVRK